MLQIIFAFLIVVFISAKEGDPSAKNIWNIIVIIFIIFAFMIKIISL